MELYRNYIIERGGLGYTYAHQDYEGVTFIGEDIESRDRRCGSAYTIEQCKEEIDEIEEERLDAISEYNREPEINPGK